MLISIRQNVIEVCNHCDSLIFDYTDSTYVSFSTQGNTTSINELTFNKINNNKMYDLLGRELNEIPVGTMYIRNNKIIHNKIMKRILLTLVLALGLLTANAQN